MQRGAWGTRWDTDSRGGQAARTLSSEGPLPSLLGPNPAEEIGQLLLNLYRLLPVFMIILKFQLCALQIVPVSKLIDK